MVKHLLTEQGDRPGGCSIYLGFLASHQCLGQAVGIGHIGWMCIEVSMCAWTGLRAACAMVMG